MTIFNYKFKIEDYRVKESHKFDEENLSDYLSDKLADFSSIRAVGQFNVGQSNPTFIIESTEGKRYVLRKKPPGDLLPSAHAVDREFKVQNALYETDVPVGFFGCIKTINRVLVFIDSFNSRWGNLKSSGN